MTEGAGCRSVEELPAYRECAGVGRRAHPGYPVEPGPPEIVAVVVHRERSDLESDVAPEESRSLDGGRDAGGIVAEHRRAPPLHADLELEVEDPAPEGRQELALDRRVDDRVGRRLSLRPRALRGAVPAVQDEPLPRRDPRVDRDPVGAPGRRDEPNPRILIVAGRLERGVRRIASLDLAVPPAVPRRDAPVVDVLRGV